LIADWLPTADGEQDWKFSFKIGGGSLLATGLVSQAYVISGITNAPQDPHEKKNLNKPIKIAEEETFDATFKNNKLNDSTVFTEAPFTEAPDDKGTSNDKNDPDPPTPIVPMQKVHMPKRNISRPHTENPPQSNPPQFTPLPPLDLPDKDFPIDCPRYATALLPPYKRVFPKKNSERFQ
jgi:hypothetical protein